MTSGGRAAYGLGCLAARPGEVLRTTSGPGIVAPHPLEAAVGCDLVALSNGPGEDAVDERVHRVLRKSVEAGSRLLSVCSGAFSLGAAGLLDGRRCAIHWRLADRLADRLAGKYPDAEVDLDVLYVQDGPITTSAGTAAGIDACLHLGRSELGSEVATRIARRMVVPPHREGGQRQYIDHAVPVEACDTLQPVLAWALEHLDEDHSVPALARRARMSERTFARRFADDVGTTPHRWLTAQRVLRACHLLETTELDVERVAHAVGFASAAVLRHHFQRQMGLAPLAYRRQFASLLADAPA